MSYFLEKVTQLRNINSVTQTTMPKQRTFQDQRYNMLEENVLKLEIKL